MQPRLSNGESKNLYLRYVSYENYSNYAIYIEWNGAPICMIIFFNEILDH